MSPRENWRGFSTSLASTMRPAQVPKMGLPAAWNFSIAGSNSHSPMSLSSVVDSPPGMMSPATSSSVSGLRTSTASTPERASARAWSAKSPWRASTPIRTLLSLTDSPRLRLRLARPDSQTRLASGCGSHDPIHRLASPPAAARTTRFTDSPRLRLRLARPDSQTRLACGCGSHDHPRLTGERQGGDSRRHGPRAQAYRHGAAGLGVLAAHERERDRAPEAERARRARDSAHGGAVDDDLGAVRRRRVALEHEAGEPPVHVTAVADAHHDLLPRVAPLGVRDQTLERDLGEEHALVHVVTEERRARLDPERFVRGNAERPRATADERVPHAGAVCRPARDPGLETARLPAARHEADGDPVERRRDARR